MRGRHSATGVFGTGISLGGAVGQRFGALICAVVLSCSFGCTAELQDKLLEMSARADAAPQVADSENDDPPTAPSGPPVASGLGSLGDRLDAGSVSADAAITASDAGTALADDMASVGTLHDAGADGDDRDPTSPFPALEGSADAGDGAAPPVALGLLGSEPVSGATAVDVDITLVLSFDRDVRAGDGQVVLLEVADSLRVEAIPAMDPRVHFYHGSTDSGPWRVTVDWDARLRHDTEYAVVVEPNAIFGIDGSTFVALNEASALTFTTDAPTPVELVSSSPLPDATDVARDADVVLSFSDEIAAGAVGEIALLDLDADEIVAHETVGANPRVQISGTTLTFNPSADLGYATTYLVLLDAGAVRSASGAAFAGLGESDALAFTTQLAPLPTLVGSAPPTGATNVDPDANLVLSFDMQVLAGEGTISVFDSSSGMLFEAVEMGDPRVTVSNVSVTVDPAASLENSTGYYVNVSEGALVSSLGAAFAGIGDTTTLTFTTAAVPPPPLQLVGTTPANDATEVDASTDLVLIFSEAVSLGSGSVTVFRASDGSVFESVPVEDERTTLAGDSVTVELSATLAANTAYYVTVGAGAFISVRGAAFAGILGPDASESGEFGFTTAHPFVLVSTQPADGANAVKPSAPLVLEFSAPVEAETGDLVISAGSNVVEVIAIDGPQVSIDGAVVTITPSAPLQYGTHYGVSLEAGALRKLEGPAFPAILNADWTFTTLSACDAGESRGPSGDCYYFAAGPANWDDAREACDRGEGWDLARIADAADQNFVQGLVTKDAWIGGNDEAEPGKWRWIDNGVQFWQGGVSGDSVGGAYEHWKSDQPSGGEQHCARVLSSANNWLWADAGCDEEYALLCRGPAN